jgi:hypothetical protein
VILSKSKIIPFRDIAISAVAITRYGYDIGTEVDDDVDVDEYFNANKHRQKSTKGGKDVIDLYKQIGWLD